MSAAKTTPETMPAATPSEPPDVLTLCEIWRLLDFGPDQTPVPDPDCHEESP